MDFIPIPRAAKRRAAFPHEKLSYVDALANNLKHYYTEPCANGHVAYRRVSDHGCTTCSYMRSRKYEDKYPEKRKLIGQRERQQRRVDRRAWATSRFQYLRAASKKRNVPFNLTIEYILSLIPADDLCPALGVPLGFGEGFNKNTASIDRINPTLGYTIGNVNLISQKANQIKQDCIDPDELRKVANYMERVTVR
jgi:hypothetical protein